MHRNEFVYVLVYATVDIEKQLLQIESEVCQFLLLNSFALADLFVVSFVANYQLFCCLLTALDVLSDSTSGIFGPQLFFYSKSVSNYCIQMRNEGIWRYVCFLQVRLHIIIIHLVS